MSLSVTILYWFTLYAYNLLQSVTRLSKFEQSVKEHHQALHDYNYSTCTPT